MSDRSYRIVHPEYAGDPKILTWDWSDEGCKGAWREITSEERLDALESLVLEMHKKISTTLR